MLSEMNPTAILLILQRLEVRIQNHATTARPRKLFRYLPCACYTHTAEWTFHALLHDKRSASGLTLGPLMMLQKKKNQMLLRDACQ